MASATSATSLRREISRRGVRETIDAAERPFRDCWKTLVQIRGGTGRFGFGARVLRFQSTLIDALSKIEEQRVAIKREERRLVRNKARYSPVWFAKRMETLKGYGEVLLKALAIGRALGDGFAWMFYERDGPLIHEHFKNERQVGIPTGVGGFGERSSAKSIKALGGRLMIYHGTTTFLRIGDVSLVELSPIRVCGIGEIKTERIDAKQVQVRIEVLSDVWLQLQSAEASQSPQPTPVWSSPKMQDRVARQRKTLHAALNAASKAAVDKRLGREGEFHFEVLDRLVQRCNSKRFEYATPDPGLVIGALRMRGRRSLSSNLLAKTGEVTGKIAGIEKWAAKILEPKHPESAIVLGSIGHPDNLPLAPEGMPFTLWPAADATIESLLFGNVMTLTLYNPAPFWRAIEARGFELTREHAKAPVRARRNLGAKIQDLHNYDYFQRLTQIHLMSLPAVMDLVDSTLKLTEDPQLHGPARINVRPQVVRSPRTTGVRYDDL